MQPKPKKSTAPKKPVQKKKSNSPVDMYKNMVDPATGKKGTMGGEGTRPPFEKGDLPVKSATLPKRTYVGGKPAKNGKTMMKAKNGKSFPDLNKDGKITKADILKGRGVIAKKGATIKKAQNGTKTKDSTAYFKKSADINAKVALAAAKYGYRNLSEKAMADSYKDTKSILRQTRKGQPGYDANGFPIKKKKAKAGASVKKCRGGCK